MEADKSITLIVVNTDNNVSFDVVPYDDVRSFICAKEEKEKLLKYLPGKMITFRPRDADRDIKVTLFDFYNECVMKIQLMPDSVKFMYGDTETMTDDSMSAQSVYQLHGVKFDMLEAIERCSEFNQVIDFQTFAEALSSLQAEIVDGSTFWSNYVDRFYTIYSYFQSTSHQKH